MTPSGSDRTFAALDLTWPAVPDEARVDQVLAELDDAHPTAVEQTPLGVRVFFANAAERARAEQLARIIAPDAEIRAVDVPDERWAERSQAMLTAVRVGRFVVTPPWYADEPIGPDELRLIVQPSMGFGTGHHPSTRLCLRLLQTLRLAGVSVLDVGTGSGVLAMAAARLGGSPVVALDVDADALISARENLEMNDLSDRVEAREIDLTTDRTQLGRFDLVLANLTGAMIAREAGLLASLVAPRGHLIASGFQPDEVDAVTTSLVPHGLTLVERADEDGWVGVKLGKVRS